MMVAADGFPTAEVRRYSECATPHESDSGEERSKAASSHPNVGGGDDGDGDGASGPPPDVRRIVHHGSVTVVASPTVLLRARLGRVSLRVALSLAVSALVLAGVAAFAGVL